MRRVRRRDNELQNFPKKAQKFLKEIFAEELKTDPWLIEQGGMPSIRQIVKPPEGWVLMESDFCQAELFTIAGLSGDANMWRALNTPGLDLHDKTATDSLGIVTIAPDGHTVTDEERIQRAGVMYARHGGGTPAFDKKAYEDEFDGYLGTLTYVDKTGKSMSRKEMKAGPRIVSKGVSFGKLQKLLKLKYSF